MSFNAQLRDLSPKQARVFCVAIAERMLPNYRIFAEQFDAEMYQKARAILDVAWEALIVPKVRVDFEKQAEKLLELQPDPVLDQSLASYLGLDAILAVEICLLVSQKSDDEQVSISRLSRSTVARFLEVSEPEFVNMKLSEHPLMKYEHDCQNEILDYVLNNAELGSQSIKELRQLIKAQEVSNIGLEL